jgi:hypothetical protein
MVDIESGDSVALSVEDLERFVESIDSTRGATGTAASLNSETGALAASFSVEADEAGAAATEAVALFRQALRLADLADVGPTKVAVEQMAEPVSAS